MNEPRQHPTRQEIFGAVRACIADSLSIEESVIQLESRLIYDLDADSLDFLDITFSLEKKFSVKLHEGGLERLMRAQTVSGELQGGEYLRQDDLAELKPWLPALANAPDPKKITPQGIFSYITVETLVLLVENKLGKSL